MAEMMPLCEISHNLLKYQEVNKKNDLHVYLYR
jgi:hypothetical protein